MVFTAKQWKQMIGWKVWHKDKMADQGLLNALRQLRNETERDGGD